MNQINYQSSQPIMPTCARSPRQWEALARVRIKKGESAAAIARDFVWQGLDEPSAQRFVDQAYNTARNHAVALLVGSLALVFLGFIVTVVSIAAAGGGGILWWGPMLCGGIAAIIGLVRLCTLRR